MNYRSRFISFSITFDFEFLRMIRYFDLNHFNDFHLSSFLKIKSWNSWTVIKWCIEISIYCYRYRHIVSYSTVRKKYRPFSIYWDICFSHVDSVNNCFFTPNVGKAQCFSSLNYADYFQSDSVLLRLLSPQQSPPH